MIADGFVEEAVAAARESMGGETRIADGGHERLQKGGGNQPGRPCRGGRAHDRPDHGFLQQGPL